MNVLRIRNYDKKRTGEKCVNKIHEKLSQNVFTIFDITYKL